MVALSSRPRPCSTYGSFGSGESSESLFGTNHKSVAPSETGDHGNDLHKLIHAAIDEGDAVDYELAQMNDSLDYCENNDAGDDTVERTASSAEVSRATSS